MGTLVDNKEIWSLKSRNVWLDVRQLFTGRLHTGASSSRSMLRLNCNMAYTMFAARAACTVVGCRNTASWNHNTHCSNSFVQQLGVWV